MGRSIPSSDPAPSWSHYSRTPLGSAKLISDTSSEPRHGAWRRGSGGYRRIGRFRTLLATRMPSVELAQCDSSMSADHRDCGAYFAPFLLGRLYLEDQLGPSRGSSRTPLMVAEQPMAVGGDFQDHPPGHVDHRRRLNRSTLHHASNSWVSSDPSRRRGRDDDAAMARRGRLEAVAARVA